MSLHFSDETVSIVIPFFRSGHLLSEAVESVLRQQGYDHWRLYLVNDGSDDTDVAIARRFQSEMPERVSFLEHEGGIQRGASASRNLGIRQSHGEWIAFLDADDTWYPHKLETQVKLLERHPNVGMVYGPALRWWSWNGGQDVCVPAVVDGFGWDCCVPGEALLRTFLRDEGLTPCMGSTLIRRSAALAAGLFEEQFWGLYDDQAFYAKLCRNSDIYVSSNCVSRYRQHKLSCCRQSETLGTVETARSQFLQWLRAYEKQGTRSIQALRPIRNRTSKPFGQFEGRKSSR